jgi:hypothetical protein
MSGHSRDSANRLPQTRNCLSRIHPPTQAQANAVTINAPDNASRRTHNCLTLSLCIANTIQLAIKIAISLQE